MSSILFELKDGVGVISFNRPDKLNAFTREMSLQLQRKLDDCEADSHIRCVVLTGSGKAFSAGQDLAELTGPNPPGMDQVLSEHYNPIVKKITGLSKPVLASVNGVAAGAGANIALCCDITVATASASFIQAFSKIGLIPDSGGTWFLPRLIGYQKASALMLLGDKVTASEAESMGMIYRCFDDGQFESGWQTIAKKLAHLPPLALAYTKKALQYSLSHSLPDQLKKEDELQQMAAQTNDYKEGVQAFLEKRPALFTGT